MVRREEVDGKGVVEEEGVVCGGLGESAVVLGVVKEAGGRARLHDIVCREGVVGGREEPGGWGAGGVAPVAESDSAAWGGDGREEEGVAVGVVCCSTGAA